MSKLTALNKIDEAWPYIREALVDFVDEWDFGHVGGTLGCDHRIDDVVKKMRRYRYRVDDDTHKEWYAQLAAHAVLGILVLQGDWPRTYGEDVEGKIRDFQVDLELQQTEIKFLKAALKDAKRERDAIHKGTRTGANDAVSVTRASDVLFGGEEQLERTVGPDGGSGGIGEPDKEE